jgi:hypothetical protein
MNTLPTQEERHAELARLLAPQTAAEDMLIGWLAGSLSPRGSYETMIRMLERATGQAYNRGWSAACDAFAEHEQPASPSSLERDQEVGDERRGKH